MVSLGIQIFWVAPMKIMHLRHLIIKCMYCMNVVIRQCAYVTFYIKHRVALSLIITAPRMRLVRITWITTKVSEHRRAGNIV